MIIEMESAASATDAQTDAPESKESPQTTTTAATTTTTTAAATPNGYSKEKRNEIKVFKKSSLSGKITVYLGKRDFVDHIAYVDPIDGVVLIDREHVKSKKVFVHVLAAFSYGRDDLDVLGLAFRKELYLVSDQIYPDASRQHHSKLCPYFIDGVSNVQTLDAAGDKDETAPSSPHQQQQQRVQPKRLTRLQERLVKKLGPNAFPFFFELPPLVCPASVTLQPGPGDSGKPCGVDYELKVYVMDDDERPSKRDTIRLAIRKIMYAPLRGHNEQPMVEVSKDFMMSPNKLNLEVSLDKDLYYHGESIAVNVHVSNNSNRTVKKVRVAVRQYADICLFSTAQYKCTVAEIESEEGCPVGPGSTLSKVYYLCPLLVFNKDKRGLALDGQLKHEDTNLASSTLLNESSQKENLGIVVQYKVRVKLSLGALGGEITAELPFTLMHPKPEGEDDLLISKSSPIGIGGYHRRGSSRNPLEMIFSNATACKCHLREQESESESEHDDAGERIRGDKANLDEQNLIQLDDDSDIIFEDFARMQLNQNDLYNSCQMANEDEQQELDCFRRLSSGGGGGGGGGGSGQPGASHKSSEFAREPQETLTTTTTTASGKSPGAEDSSSESTDNKPLSQGSNLKP